MILSFRHKGLRLLFERGDRRRILPEAVEKVERVMARLNEATGPNSMDLPGFRLHQLTGNLRGNWSVVVSGNWRILFRFEGTDVVDVDFVDYH